MLKLISLLSFIENGDITKKILIPVQLITIFIVYFALHQTYRPYNVDDAWGMSPIYNTMVQDIGADETFGLGTRYNLEHFGKTFSLAYGTFLNIFGWTRSNAIILSILFVTVGSVSWFFVLKKLKFDQATALAGALLFMLYEPFFGAANQARYDAILYLFLTLSVLSFVYNFHFLSSIFASLAVEVHPAGLMAYIFLGSALLYYFIYSDLKRSLLYRMTGNIIAGGIIGIIAYLYLYHETIPFLLEHLSNASQNTSPYNLFPILYSYFFETYYLRHIPELILILICAVYFIKGKYYKEKPLVLVLFIAALLTAIITRRGNFHYTVYLYPSFLILFITTFYINKRFNLFVIISLIYLCPQYAFVYYKNHQFDQNEYENLVLSKLPNDNLQVFANSYQWFALKEREFYCIYYKGIERIPISDFYLIDYKRNKNNHFEHLQDRINNNNYKSEDIAEFIHHNRNYMITRYTLPE